MKKKVRKNQNGKEMEKDKPGKSELILYQTEDGQTRIEVRLQDETVWMTQSAMAELYQTTSQNITIHLKSIFAEGEMDESSTCKEYLQVQQEGSRTVSRTRKFYNLPAIIAVGYRVKSRRGTQFRRWATDRLNEFLVKGFTLDDERLKAGSNIGSDYFGIIRFLCGTGGKSWMFFYSSMSASPGAVARGPYGKRHYP